MELSAPLPHLGGHVKKLQNKNLAGSRLRVQDAEYQGDSEGVFEMPTAHAARLEGTPGWRVISAEPKSAKVAASGRPGTKDDVQVDEAKALAARRAASGEPDPPALPPMPQEAPQEPAEPAEEPQAAEPLKDAPKRRRRPNKAGRSDA